MHIVCVACVYDEETGVQRNNGIQQPREVGGAASLNASKVSFNPEPPMSGATLLVHWPDLPEYCRRPAGILRRQDK